MTTMKFIFISIIAIVFISSETRADIADPDIGNENTIKLTLFGHTGQDPAPKRDSAMWGGPIWTNEKFTKNPMPTKEDLFSLTYFEKKDNTGNFPNIKSDWSTHVELPESVLNDFALSSPPLNGSIPAPPASVLFALGFLKKRRRVE